MPESNRHPAKMLPELARRAISAYSDPGDLVLDPMCGIGTTVVEASHLDRRAIGVELEPRWTALAARNLEHARGQGATGQARVLEGDARQLGAGLLDEYVGTAALVLTSPPYGDAHLGDSRAGDGMARCRASEGRRVTAADLATAAQLQRVRRYGDSAGSVASLRYGTTEEALRAPSGGGGGG
ncbi:MAG: TRM11 family SAM-dependent methyltransferase, partial [Solirubrobacteraceae bacterium]